MPDSSALRPTFAESASSPVSDPVGAGFGGTDLQGAGGVAGGTPLTLDEAVALARDTSDRAALDAIIGRLPAELREEGRRAAESVAPLAENPETEAILANNSTGLTYWIFRDAILDDTSTEGVAARLLDWVAGHGWIRSVSKDAALLARRFPEALTPKRTERLVKACVAPGVADLDPDMLVYLLLEREAFSSADLLRLYEMLPSDAKSARALIVNRRATPELWITVAEAGAKIGAPGDTHERYLRQLSDIEVLMDHAPAMAAPEVADALLRRSELTTVWVSDTELLLHRLARRLPAGVALESGHASRIIEQLFHVNIAAALRIIEQLPDEWRSCVTRDRLIDLAVNHPDGQVRQAVILFSADVGDEVEPVHRQEVTRKA